MDTRKIIATLLIAAGALSVAYGGFSYTKTRTRPRSDLCSCK